MRGSARPRIPLNEDERGSSSTVVADAVVKKIGVEDEDVEYQTKKERMNKMKKWKERLTDSLVVNNIIPKLDRIPHDRARYFTFHIRNLEIPTGRFRIRRIVQCGFGLPTGGSRARCRCGPLQPQIQIQIQTNNNKKEHKQRYH